MATSAKAVLKEITSNDFPERTACQGEKREAVFAAHHLIVCVCVQGNIFQAASVPSISQ
jgi:hypothetical protein